MTEKKILQRAIECARVAADNKGSDVVLLELTKLSSVADYFLIVSGSSDRRVQSIAEALIEKMKELGVRPIGVEGVRGGKWALIDFGEIVAHIFFTEVRAEFDLEGLWFDAKRIKLPETTGKPGHHVMGAV